MSDGYIDIDPEELDKVTIIHGDNDYIKDYDYESLINHLLTRKKPVMSMKQIFKVRTKFLKPHQNSKGPCKDSMKRNLRLFLGTVFKVKVGQRNIEFVFKEHKVRVRTEENKGPRKQTIFYGSPKK